MAQTDAAQPGQAVTAVHGHGRRLIVSLGLALALHVGLALVWATWGWWASSDDVLHVTRAGDAATHRPAGTRAVHDQRGNDRRSQAARTAADGAAADRRTLPGRHTLTRFVVVPVRERASATANADAKTTPAPPVPRSNARPALSRRATADARAAYLSGWQQEIETRGSRRYPARLLTTGAGRRLTLAVRIEPDGALTGLRVLRSSGNAELDAVARSIVRDAAPFPAFDPRLAAPDHELSFAYDWRFDAETASRLRPRR